LESVDVCSLAEGVGIVKIASHVDMSDSATINISEPAGITRRGEPVKIGMPLPKGVVKDHSVLTVRNNVGKVIPLQSTPLCRWSDGSLKWVLLDFLADAKAHSSEHYILQYRSESFCPISLGHSVRNSDSKIVIHADKNRYIYDSNKPELCHIALTEENAVEPLLLCVLNLTTMDNRNITFVIDSLIVEESGPVRTRLLITGVFSLSRCKRLLIVARIDHFVDSGLCKVEIEIHNPSAALHPGGVWDLGDPGSINFKDFSFIIKGVDIPDGVEWASVPGEERRRNEMRSWSLYQDSSGGAHWNSPNHVDSDNKLTVSFPGYRVNCGNNATGEPIETGDRATPLVRVKVGTMWMAAGVEQFWQNFPKALDISDNELRIALFPQQCKAGFELQGGERKRHVVWLEFGQDGNDVNLPGLLCPLEVGIDPDWVEQSRAISCFVPEEKDPEKQYINYVRNAIEGDNSFFAKREAIDEFGWRNFGDLYADHEAAFHSGPELYPSHYNNQYDFIYGSLIHYLRSGNPVWRELMHDLARHVVDIDIYQTDEDRAAYNRGLFWHSYHYQPAGTGTHRGFTKVGIPPGQELLYGGGPSNEQDYSSGLTHYHYLSGDPWAREVVIGLADWVMAMDDGNLTLLGALDNGPTGLASQTGSTDYHHPGRGAGNSINTLLDAYCLTNNRKYFDKGEQLIRRCIHPKDHLNTLKLDEPEIRWFYLVFLQILGKYLDNKNELEEFDFMFFYARDSLLHYAQWIYDNEVPYKDVLHKVEYPTETWSAQDVRKSCVMNLAAKYSSTADIRHAYREKARYFYDRCLNDLLTFKTAYLARPMVLLTVYGSQQGYFENHPDDFVPYKGHMYDFGEPAHFLNQRQRVKDSFRFKVQTVTREGRRLLITKAMEMFPMLKLFFRAGA